MYALRCKILGEDHPDTLTTLNNLSVTYYQLGNYQKAYDTMKLAYLGCSRILGANHPDTISSKNDLEYIRKKLAAQNTPSPTDKKPSFFQRIFKKKK